MGYYHPVSIEKKWQQYWKENKIFVTDKTPSAKPKYYVLDMFPYPSGSGLHVGHPLGYIATDIIARYKRAKGFNVLHPMGFDAFGLPGEQYAIQKGIHPSITTAENTQRYWQQMEQLGFCYDPECTLNTSDADYYKWTQWIFLQLFQHYYCVDKQQARPITELTTIFEREGNGKTHAATTQKAIFSAQEWEGFSAKEKHDILMNYRLAYHSFGYVNWCQELGTVLANDEVKDGKSERGGHPVERRKMPQWMLRITAYADRLISGLDAVDFPESIKVQQENWIGKSEGGNIRYAIAGHEDLSLEIFTTRPDTIFGNTYMVIAPEHEYVTKLTTTEQAKEVGKYVVWAKNRSERERQADTTKTGVFTGAFCIHPFTGEKLPIWVADYVLIGYGTGAIMAVPAHDERDYEFAKKFHLEIKEVVSGGNIEKEAFVSKEGTLINSDFITGMKVSEAIASILAAIEAKEIGRRQTTFRLRDVIWSRQRYWGEPTPLITKDDMFYPVSVEDLPIVLPELEDFKPTGKPESPLIKAQDWVNLPDGFMRETNTMPGAAGSSWYFFRYFDKNNDSHFSDRKKSNYWMPVDLYLGGAEHAVGHLLYSRFWTKFLYDIQEVAVDEPYKKLVNQGIIQGVSALVYRHKETNEYYSADIITDKNDYSVIYTDVNFVRNLVLDTEKTAAFWKEPNAVFHRNASGEFKVEPLVEKMSKSRYNTVTPDSICEEYGADTLRLYEMFLGPLEASKPWGMEGIQGVVRFIRKVYNMFIDDHEEFIPSSSEAPTPAEYKALHKLIQKVENDIERLSFNTCIPAFMNFVTEMGECRKAEIRKDFLSVLAPFAPHICEELHEKMGGTGTILDAPFPRWNPDYLTEDSFDYPIQINGKLRAKIHISLDATQEEVEALVTSHEEVQRWLGGKPPKKIILVVNKIVNVVV